MAFANDAASVAAFLCLIAEDDGIIALTMEEAFNDAGHDVGGPFATCTEAESWLALNTPAVAVVDAHLRDGLCLNLIRALRGRQIPTVIFSGDTLDIEVGENVVLLSKPALFATVVKTAARLVGNDRAFSGPDAGETGTR